MKDRHWLLLFVSLTAGFLTLQAPVSGESSVPRLEGYVNDDAGLLTQGERAKISDLLRQFEEKTGNQVVLLTVDSLGGENLEEFSIRVAEEWKIGRKDRDNGAILLISKQDRKIRIEVGYGLEGVLTDAQCSQIIRNVMAPLFRQSNYAGGIYAGLTAMVRVIGGEAPPEPRAVHVRQSNDSGKLSETAIMIITIVVVLLFFRFTRRFTRGSHSHYRTGRRRSGIYFGGFGGFGGRGLGGGGFGGGFSGGGGSFGGGGASGGW